MAQATAGGCCFKFKGLRADLLSPAFPFNSVSRSGMYEQPLLTHQFFFKPGGKDASFEKDSDFQVVKKKKMCRSPFPDQTSPLRRCIQEQCLSATSKARVILRIPKRALNKAKVEVVHKHKRNQGKLGEPDTLTFYSCCLRPGPGHLEGTVGGRMARGVGEAKLAFLAVGSQAGYLMSLSLSDV